MTVDSVAGEWPAAFPVLGEKSVTEGVVVRSLSGEIEGRFVAPKPLGTPPLPRSEWPTRVELQHFAGWRVARADRANGGGA